jgi:hypothetical protein
MDSLESALTASSPYSKFFRDDEIVLAVVSLLGFVSLSSASAQNYYQ